MIEVCYSSISQAFFDSHADYAPNGKKKSAFKVTPQMYFLLVQPNECLLNPVCKLLGKYNELIKGNLMYFSFPYVKIPSSLIVEFIKA